MILPLSIRCFSTCVAAIVACGVLLPTSGSEGARSRMEGVTKAEYLDLMDAAVASYSDAHLQRYVADVERDGVVEHGFPRLAANLGMLVSKGRLPEKRDILKRMLTLCCKAAPKGKMKFEGNEFSVKELAIAVSELERSGVFEKSVTDEWKADLSAVDAERCYRVQRPVGFGKASNWLVFGCASEQARLALGMGGDSNRVERYVTDQIRWFDSNGMYRDPNQPSVYDLVTRLQFMFILQYGYDGQARDRLEALLDRSAEPTLMMLSAAGEIPYGGRSNQFLHNHTLYAGVCEWYAARYYARGDIKRAARFRRAARHAVDALQKWLSVRPPRHIKNYYPRVEGLKSRVEGIKFAGIGCEHYAYFDKYMITMGSWAMLAYLFADESVPPCAASVEESAPDSFATTPDFHRVFLLAGDYSAQFDYASDTMYDCEGLGRFQRYGAPEAIFMSVPCARSPKYRTEFPNAESLAFVPVGNGELHFAGHGHDATGSWSDWTLGSLTWKCRLTDEGLSSNLLGEGAVAMKVPAFAYDGEKSTEISCLDNSLTIRYLGWTCEYVANGKFVDTGKISCNRNGRYRIFEVRGNKNLSVKVTIKR